MRVIVYGANSTARDAIGTALSGIFGSFGGWTQTGTAYYNSFALTWDEYDELRYQFGDLYNITGFKFTIVPTDASLLANITSFLSAVGAETNVFVDLGIHNSHVISHINRIDGRGGLSATRIKEKKARRALNIFGGKLKEPSIQRAAREVVELDPDDMPDVAGDGTTEVEYKHKKFVWSSTPAAAITGWSFADCRKVRFIDCEFADGLRIDGLRLGIYTEEGCEGIGAYPWIKAVGTARIESKIVHGNRTEWYELVDGEKVALPSGGSAPYLGDYNYGLRIQNEDDAIKQTSLANSGGVASFTDDYTTDGSEEFNVTTLTSLNDAMEYDYNFNMNELTLQEGGLLMLRMEARYLNTSGFFGHKVENITSIDCDMGDTEIGMGDVMDNMEWGMDRLVWGGTYRGPIDRPSPETIGVGGLHWTKNVLVLDSDNESNQIRFTSQGQPNFDLYIQGGSSSVVGFYDAVSRGWRNNWGEMYVDDHDTGKITGRNVDSATRHVDGVVRATNCTVTQFANPQRSLLESTYCDYVVDGITLTFTGLSQGAIYPIKGNIYYENVTSNGLPIPDAPVPP